MKNRFFKAPEIQLAHSGLFCSFKDFLESDIRVILIQNKKNRKERSEQEWQKKRQRIAFTVFEVTKQAYEKSFNNDELLNAVEYHVNKAYKSGLEQLLNENEISQDLYNNALAYSNIDEMSDNKSHDDFYSIDENNDNKTIPSNCYFIKDELLIPHRLNLINKLVQYQILSYIQSVLPY